MRVVSNTSPIMNLAIIGALSLLRDQFGEILIPGAVLEVLRVEEDLPGSQNVRDALTLQRQLPVTPNLDPVMPDLIRHPEEDL